MSRHRARKAAVAELCETGSVGRQASPALERLLALEGRARYDRRGVTAAVARAAVRRAGTLIAAAEAVLAP